jgi:hypothetical protein
VLSVNFPPYEVKDRTKANLGEATHYYEVAIQEKGVQYTIVHPKVKASDGIRDCALKISIIIPKGYRIAGGVNPYDVLKEINDLFWSVNINADERRFKADKAPAELFRERLDKYALEEYHGAYREMKGLGYALTIQPEEAAREIFKDVHYREFAPFKEIVIAQAGSAENMLMTLPVPRQITIGVRINHTKRLELKGDDLNKIIKIDALKALGLPSDCYEPLELRFCVAEIFKGTKYEFVEFDATEETIVCRPEAKEKTQIVKLEVYGSRNEAIPDGILRISSDGKVLPISNGCVTLRAKQILNSTLVVSSTDPCFTVDRYEIKGNVMSVIVRHNPRPAYSSLGGANSANLPPMLEVKIDNLRDVDKHRRIFELYFECDDELRAHRNIDMKGRYKVPVPSHWLGKNVAVYGQNSHYELFLDLDKIHISPGINNAYVTAYKRPFFQIYKKALVIILIILAVVGVASAVLFLWKDKNGFGILDRNAKIAYNEVLAFRGWDTPDPSFQDIRTAGLKIDTLTDHSSSIDLVIGEGSTEEIIRPKKDTVDAYNKVVKLFPSTKMDKNNQGEIKKKIEEIEKFTESAPFKLLSSKHQEILKKCCSKKDCLGYTLATSVVDDFDDLNNEKQDRSVFVFDRKTANNKGGGAGNKKTGKQNNQQAKQTTESSSDSYTF